MHHHSAKAEDGIATHHCVEAVDLIVPVFLGATAIDHLVVLGQLGE